MKKNLFYFLSVLGLFCCLFLFHNMYILAAYNIVFVSLYNILYKPIFGNLVLYSVSLWLITTLLLAVEIVVNISVWDIIITELYKVAVFAVFSGFTIILVLFAENKILKLN